MCDFQQPLSGIGVKFVDGGGMFLPGWPGSFRWDIGASYSEISPQIFLTDSSFRCFVARRVGIIISDLSSKKRVRKSFSKSPQCLMEPSGSFMNHSKASYFRVSMNKRAKMASLSNAFPV